MISNKYKRRIVENRKKNLLCVACGKPMDREGTYCRACVDKQNIRTKKIRAERKSKGICPRCGKEELWGDEQNCLECAAKGYESVMRTRVREHYNEMHREWDKQNREKMAEKGICYRCRKRPADYGFKSCAICRSQFRKTYHKNHNIPDRRMRYKQGLCYYCDNPIKPGYKVCTHHYDLNVKNAHSDKCKVAREINKKRYAW